MNPPVQNSTERICADRCPPPFQTIEYITRLSQASIPNENIGIDLSRKTQMEMDYIR